MNGENMNTVISTILLFAHIYSCKRFAGKSSTTTATTKPTRSQSHTIHLISASTQQTLHRSNSETALRHQKSTRMNNNYSTNLTMPSKKTADINQDYEQQGSYQEHHLMMEPDKEEYREDQEEPNDIATTVIKQHDTILSPTSLCNHYSNKALPSCPPTSPFKKSAHGRSSSTSSSIMERVWGEPPFDIQRPNCVPGFGAFDITTFKDDPHEQEHDDEISIQGFLDSTLDFDDDNDMYDTKQSHTPSSSGDSGYGTRRKNRRRSSSIQLPSTKTTETTHGNKVQNLFEALFAPITTPTTSTAPSPPSLKIHPASSKSTASLTGTASSRGSNRNSLTSPTKKLSLLFSKSRASHQQQSKEPHFVKYQTWSNNNDKHNKSSTTHANSGSIRRPHEENLFKGNNDVIMEEELLPPTIKIQEPTTKRSSMQTRGRRRTDASLIRVKSEILTLPSIVTTPSPTPALPKSAPQKHGRCKSIGSLDLLSPATPNTALSLISPTIQETSNILDHCDQDGNMIARYKLGNVIGKGHFGTVFRALDLISGKTVAVKQINLKDSRKADIEDMMQEASLLSSLTHGNIVKYEGFIQTQEHMNIVLEYVENGSLLHTLKHFGHALPEHLVASYCYDILQGLAYLHQQDVVHCDLKAANILTTKAGVVKLSDFGVSLNLKLKNHEENLVSGTPFWMSPEVIELKGASVQSDIWSLGCTVIELYTGKPPYADLLTMTAMFKIVEDDCPPLPEGISDDFKDFLKLCFKKNPVERPKAIHLMHHPWVSQKDRNAPPPPNTPSTPTALNNNSTILQNYLKKAVQKDDNLTLDIDRLPKRKNSAASVASPISNISSPIAPYVRPFGHTHAMVKITFAEGSGPMCPFCKERNQETASMCTSGCGLVCHPPCFEKHVLKTQSIRGNAPGKCPECLDATCPHTMVASRPAPAPIIAPKPTASISTQLTSLFKKKENKKSMNGFDDYHKYMRVMNARKSTQPGTMTLGSSSPTTPKNSSSKTWWKKNGK
ncbi:Protein kinase of the Mitotic Exit Network [Mucor circinelloides]